MSQEPIDPQTLAELRACTEALEDRKAKDLRILDVRGKSSITDFLVICSGTSSPHLRALCTSAEKALFNSPGKVSRHRDEFESGWVVTDGVDFVVHIFTEEMRGLFRLEALWKDATEIPLSEIQEVSSTK
ncbi:ribosome silencing factor [Puniceicoccus vermicola]|uniref:Ribosomal silencing factor RsfS n=1 Tax=Puniceicoccus vermicola TaxID=388746 RepID=A0A7X1AVX9_9BACT|nr:ribosome silencing factor [Puniceicoccus vermicola]MBC2600884.1 ribosome silencing factor [Puniceicoccus vermicola]